MLRPCFYSCDIVQEVQHLCFQLLQLTVGAAKLLDTVSQSKYGAFSMIFPGGPSSVFSSALGKLSYVWNDCLHTELKFITLSIVSWTDIIFLLITKGHTLQIHWTNQTKSMKGNTRMNHKQLLQHCSCTCLFLQLYLECKKVVIHINSLVMNCPTLVISRASRPFPSRNISSPLTWHWQVPFSLLRAGWKHSTRQNLSELWFFFTKDLGVMP